MFEHQTLWQWQDGPAMHMNTILKYHKNNVHNLRPDSPTPANSPLLHIRSIS